MATQPRSAYLPCAWNRDRHGKRVKAHDQDIDVLLCGTLFPERIAFLEQMNWAGVNLAIYGTTQLLSSDSPLRQYVRGGIVMNEKLFTDIVPRSKLVLNMFRAADTPAESLNPRCYEAAASGTCLVTDDRMEVREKFGSSVGIFNSPATAESVIRHLLSNDALRMSMAAEAAAAVQRDTWTDRARQIIDNLTTWTEKECVNGESAWANGGAAARGGEWRGSVKCGESDAVEPVC